MQHGIKLIWTKQNFWRLIRDGYVVSPILEELREKCLGWYGHIIRETNQLDTLDSDLKVSGLHPDQAFDKVEWCNVSTPDKEETEKDRQAKRFVIGTYCYIVKLDN